MEQEQMELLAKGLMIDMGLEPNNLEQFHKVMSVLADTYRRGYNQGYQNAEDAFRRMSAHPRKP